MPKWFFRLRVRLVLLVLLAALPALALTTSQADDDIARTYDSGISGYITKPPSFTGLRDVMKAVDLYWLQTTRLPPD
jgi:two-component system, response regulator